MVGEEIKKLLRQEKRINIEDFYKAFSGNMMLHYDLFLQLFISSQTLAAGKLY